MNRLISRRRFAHLLGVGAAAAVVRPQLGLAVEPAATTTTPGQSDVIRLSSNENPFGPSAAAAEAMRQAFSLAWRYPDEANETLVNSLAKLNSVAPEQILLGDGSSEILELCAMAFTGPDRKLVVADPTFEAIANYAKAAQAPTVKVALTSDYAHNVVEMGAVGKGGLIYICNPNNPTASITPKEQLRQFIARTPPETMILVDEAYFHFADSPDYESVIPMIRDHSNLVIARTFSKIYGMAGLRCGYALGQKETIARMRGYQIWDSVNCIALAAAAASVNDPEQVATRRRLINDAKAFTVQQLESLGYKSIPSQANFIMFDVRRPVVPLIAAMKQRNVHVGRLFPALPNHMRLTIGKHEEMERFVAVFRQVV